MENEASEVISPDFSFLQQVEKESGIKASACYQCRKCTNGCPVTFAMDYYPDQILRFIHLGLRDLALNSATIWVCSACETCTTRCPNEIDIAGLMDYLKQAAKKMRIGTKDNKTYSFHQVFLDDVKRRGRVYELGLMGMYMMKTGEGIKKLSDNSWRKDARLGFDMFRKGRLPLVSKGIKGKKEVKKLFEQKY